jgi:hypothetical protein
MAEITAQTILNDSQTYTNALKSRLDEALDELNAFVSDRQLWVSFGATYPFELEKGQRILADQLPVLEQTVFGPEFGDPTPELEKYRAHLFLAPLLDSIQTTLMGWIISGGVGISDAVQTALWENNRARRLQSLSDQLDAIHSRDAKRGFAQFTGRRAEDAILIQYAMDDDNLNWQITAKMAELAQQNVQFAINSNIAIESLQSGFSQGLAQVFMQLKKLIVDKLQLEINARISEFKAKMETIMSGYDLDKTNAGIDVSYNDLRMKSWEVGIREATDRSKSYIAQAANQTATKLEAAKGYVDGITSEIAAALGQTTGVVVDETKRTTPTA